MIALHPFPRKKAGLDPGRLLCYLETFQDQSFHAGGWQMRPGAGQPRLEYSRTLLEFITEVRNHWAPEGFRWIGWQSEAARYCLDPELIDSADIETCRKLLISHVERDRCRDGHLAEAISRGDVPRILARIKVLHDSGPLDWER